MPVSPITFSARNSTASSIRSAVAKAAATVGPPSTISRVMPSPASTFSTSSRSRRPCVSSTRNTLHALLLQYVLGHRRGLVRGEYPGRRVAHGRDHRQRQRHPQLRVEHDAHRRTLVKPGQPRGQLRIVGKDGADADQNGVVCARIWNTWLRATSPVIAIGLRPARPALPSAEIAILSVTCGRFFVMRVMWPNDRARLPRRTARYRRRCPSRAGAHDPGPRLPGWGLPAPTPRARCRP